jgi:mevalonate kinase
VSGAATGFAPGKLILSGEHAVVWGHRAIAFAVDRGTTVTLVRRPGPTGVDAATFADARLDPALRSLLPAEGWGVQIQSDLPVGRGMGSSAALAVALVRALAALEGRVADFAECHSRGFAVERVFHGNPSGVDHAVSARGGGLLYRRSAEGPIIEALPLPDLRFVVLDSGTAGDTAAEVAGVAARRPGIDGALEAIGQLTETLVTLLCEAAERGAPPDMVTLGALLSENHERLREIGVSNPQLDALVGLALRAGAYGAKLAGAGGGGVVVALARDPEQVLRAASARGLTAFPVRPWSAP